MQSKKVRSQKLKRNKDVETTQVEIENELTLYGLRGLR